MKRLPGLIPEEWSERLLKAMEPALPVAVILGVSLREAQKLVASWRAGASDETE